MSSRPRGIRASCRREPHADARPTAVRRARDRAFGSHREAAEALLLIKTRPEGYAALQRRVLELHPYSVPEVLGLPVAEGAPAYVQWVRESIPIEGG